MGQILATGKKPKWTGFAWEEGTTLCSIWEMGVSFPNNTISRSCSNEDGGFPSYTCCGIATRCNYLTFWPTPWHLQGILQLPLSVFLGENPAKKLSCDTERNTQNPSCSRKEILLHWGSLCPIGDGDREGCSPTETSSIQLLSKGGYAGIGTTSPAWMPT